MPATAAQPKTVVVVLAVPYEGSRADSSVSVDQYTAEYLLSTGRARLPEAPKPTASAPSEAPKPTPSAPSAG